MFLLFYFSTNIMTTLETIECIAVLTINKPPVNRLEHPEFIDINVLLKFLTEHNPKALIIKGTGRHFSAGADIQSIVKQSEQGTLELSLNKGKKLLFTLYELQIPVICAIEGACFGGGLEIALSAHIRVVSRKAMLSFPETMHDLMPGLTGNYMLKKYLTMGQSLEMILGNRIIHGEDAFRLGLADYLCEPKQSFDFAYQLAFRMTNGRSLKVINNIMIAVKNAYLLPGEKALEEETRLFCQLAKELKNESQQ